MSIQGRSGIAFCIHRLATVKVVCAHAQGEAGARQVLSILQDELTSTMILAGKYEPINPLTRPTVAIYEASCARQG